MSGLKIPFLIADYGPRVIAQLQREASYRQAFSVKAQGVIERYSKNTMTSPQDIKMVMENFIALTLPERKSAVAKWVFDAYLNEVHNGQQILAEDLYKIKEDLQYFDALKKSDAFAGEKDLHKYEGLAELRKTLAPYEQARRLKDAQRAERSIPEDIKTAILQETTILYDGPEGRVVIPHTIKASKYWGNHTRWCISGETTADKYFDTHNKKSPILMVIPKGGEDDKLAIVANTFWNAGDKQLEEIPEKHRGVLGAMADKVSPSLDAEIRKHLQSQKDKRKISIPDARPDIQQYPQDWHYILKLCRHDLFAEAQYHRKELFQNRDFVLAAVQQSGRSLICATNEFKADAEIVMTAIKQDGLALREAAPEFQEKREFVQIAVRQDGYAINWASKKFMGARDLVLDALHNSDPFYAPLIFKNTPPALQNDKSVVKAAVQKNATSLKFAPKTMQNDSVFIKELLTINHKMAFDFEAIKRIECAWPNSHTLKQIRYQHLCEIAKQGDLETYQKYARFMPVMWGDAETLFGTCPDKIYKVLHTETRARAKTTRALQ